MVERTTAVVLTYNGWNHTHQLLSDIRQHFKANEVLVVDNGSTDTDVQGGLSFWSGSKMLPITVLKLRDNVGFCGGANAGIVSAKYDNVVLFSNDVRIWNNRPFTFIQQNLDQSRKCLIGGKLYNYDTGWNKFGDTVYPYLEGWMLAATKKHWQELGMFDLRYHPYDFEDVDLSTTAVKHGFELVEIPGTDVQHLGAKTIGYNPERLAHTIENQNKFKEKWSL